VEERRTGCAEREGKEEKKGVVGLKRGGPTIREPTVRKKELFVALIAVADGHFCPGAKRFGG
jgi:hypothetical protein